MTLPRASLRVGALVFALTVATAGSGAAQEAYWLRTSDGLESVLPTHREVAYALARTDGGVLAGTSKGLFRWINGEWLLIEMVPLTTTPIMWLERTTDGQHWAATWGNGFYRSEDDGVTWQAAGLQVPTPFSPAVYGLIELPDGRLLGHTAVGEILVREAGEWNLLSQLPASVIRLALLPDDEIVASTGIGLFRSSDLGASWTPLPLEASIHHRVAVTPGGDWLAGLYFAFGPPGSSGGLYRSSDGGDSWTQIGLNHTGIGDVVVDADGTIYVGINTVSGQASPELEPGLWASSDGGDTWELRLGEVEVGGVMHPSRVRRILPLEAASATGRAGQMWVGTHGTGVHRFDGESWHGPDTMPTVERVARLAEADGYQFAAAWERLYRRHFGAASWEPMDAPFPCEVPVHLLAESASILWCAASSGLHRSEDGGASWSLTFEPPGSGGWIGGVAHAADGGLIVASWSLFPIPGLLEVFRSLDDGATWDGVLQTTARLATGSQTLVVMGEDGVMLLAALVDTHGGGIWRSDDDGESWTHVLGGTNVYSLAAGLGVVFAQASEGLWRSVDSGLTWDLVAPERWGIPHVDAAGTVYVATSLEGLSRSYDGGISWETINTGLDTYGVHQFRNDSEGFIHLATDYGVYRSAKRAIGIESRIETPVAALAVFPNPAHEAVSVQFELAQTGPVSLTVRDVLGRRIALLEDGVLTPGRHVVPWSPSGLAGGAYFITLLTVDSATTVRVTIVR